MTCGILIPRPGIKPVPPAVKVQSPNPWTAREVPETAHFRACLPTHMGLPSSAAPAGYFIYPRLETVL